MEAWLQTVFDWLPEGGIYYVLLGLIALFESVVGIGLLVPGSVIIVFAGFLFFHGKGEFVWLAAAGAAGAFSGDLLSYALGARLGETLMQRAPFRRYREVLRKAEVFFADHGGKSVFFGRFIGPLRGFIPFVAGGARMRPGIFLFYTAVSSIFWGIAYPGLGFLGGASWQQVRLWTGRFGLIMFLLLILFILNALFWKKAAPRLGKWFARQWQRIVTAWGRVLASRPASGFVARYPRLWSFLSDRFTVEKHSGLYLTVGLLASGLFASLFIWLAIDLPPLRSLDQQIHDLFQEVRHPAADQLLVTAAALADGFPLLLLAGYVLLWLVLRNRDFSAVILIIGLGGGELLLQVLHLLFRRPAPEPFLSHLPEVLRGFPSGHAFTAYLLCGLVIYFVLGTFAEWHTRLTVVILGTSVALLIGFSRIYLGAQWLSSVLAAYALAALWLTFLITASEMRRRYAGEFPWRAGWEPLHLSSPVRTAILGLAGAGVAGGIFSYLLKQTNIL